MQTLALLSIVAPELTPEQIKEKLQLSHLPPVQPAESAADPSVSSALMLLILRAAKSHRFLLLEKTAVGHIVRDTGQASFETARKSINTIVVSGLGEKLGKIEFVALAPPEEFLSVKQETRRFF